MVSEMENANKDEANELERLERPCWRIDCDNKIEAPLRSLLRGEPLHFHRFLLRE